MTTGIYCRISCNFIASCGI